MMYGYQDMMGWGGGIGMIAFWIILIIVFVLLVKLYTSQSSVTMEKEESPIEIIKKRYASGKIDKEEFEQKKKDLEK
ncbi:SHOCT domain-containing protein [Psychromonas sp. MB-3u-54]|uniref:SHOCT domain-containing protein n=1 Tax=Psychromonas sp. MB-3u-54 TaxID=2058319 RepID=UPI0018E29C7B|nr:SHOCT domain-containing protein [Psychromonas sp. MB-3u-54]